MIITDRDTGTRTVLTARVTLPTDLGVGRTLGPRKVLREALGAEFGGHTEHTIRGSWVGHDGYSEEYGNEFEVSFPYFGSDIAERIRQFEKAVGAYALAIGASWVHLERSSVTVNHFKVEPTPEPAPEPETTPEELARDSLQIEMVDKLLEQAHLMADGRHSEAGDFILVDFNSNALRAIQRFINSF